MSSGDLVLMVRRRAGLTQRELARRIECQQATIARWERGDRHPSYEDVQAVAQACGLQIEAHLAMEDRSWWPEIAMQLERTPIQRVYRLIPPGNPAVISALRDLAESRVPAIVIGEVAGALHGWPLVLSGQAVEICTPAADTTASVYNRLGSKGIDDEKGLRVTAIPPGTAGFADLARDARTMEIGDGEVLVAGLLDLLRIVDASTHPDARRDALAYRAVLEVQRAQRSALPVDHRSDEEKIEAWLSRQTPVG